jgi:hypothetical protein
MRAGNVPKSELEHMKKTTVMFWRNFGLTSLDVVNLLNWSVAMVRCFVCIDWIF